MTSVFRNAIDLASALKQVEKMLARGNAPAEDLGK
jgi:hypothetical protein